MTKNEPMSSKRIALASQAVEIAVQLAAISAIGNTSRRRCQVATAMPALIDAKARRVAVPWPEPRNATPPSNTLVTTASTAAVP